MAENEDIEIELNDRQEKFCYEYCMDFNATRSAIKAGYSEKTARSIASTLLTNINIQARIKKMQDNLAETAGLSRLRVLNEHMKMAFSSIAHLHNTWIERKEFEELTEDQKACIAEIDTKIRTEYEYNSESDEKEPVRVEYVRVKLYDKQKALDSISKMLGFDAPTKLSVEVTQLPDILIQ